MSTRKRKALRVPLSQVQRTSALDELGPSTSRPPPASSIPPVRSVPPATSKPPVPKASAPPPTPAAQGVTEDFAGAENPVEPSDSTLQTLPGVDTEELLNGSEPPAGTPSEEPEAPAEQPFARVPSPSMIPDFTDDLEEEEIVPRGPWFQDFFGEHYLRTVHTPTPREVSRECDFIEKALALPMGAKILDVGCGFGLHAVELAARGYRVVGIDISEAMLHRARGEAEDRGLDMKFLTGDMRDLPFEEAFDALLCWGTSFGYFDDEANEQTIDSFSRALKTGGVLLVDVVNRDYMIGSQPNTVWFEVNGSTCMEETTFNYETSRLLVKRNVVFDDGEQRDREYSIRLYPLHEMKQLMASGGFEVESVSGHKATLGVFFGVHSPKMIVRAEKRDPDAPAVIDTLAPPPVPRK